jgi:hypothetical protein
MSCVAWGTAQPRALFMFEGLVVSEVPICGVKAHVLKETQGLDGDQRSRCIRHGCSRLHDDQYRRWICVAGLVWTGAQDAVAPEELIGSWTLSPHQIYGPLTFAWRYIQMRIQSFSDMVKFRADSRYTGRLSRPPAVARIWRNIDELTQCSSE